jgi:tetratricopeptide (TPR) repeat protein
MSEQANDPVVDQIRREFRLLRTDPQSYLAMIEERIAKDPDNPGNYFDRHFAWEQFGQLDRALADLNKALELEPEGKALLFSRGTILRSLGRYEDAIWDFDRAFALDDDKIYGDVGLVFRADCHARLGNEAAALADAARLSDEHWMPGFSGLPGGNREQVIEELRRRAAAARAMKPGG